jgi:hypothetical protein
MKRSTKNSLANLGYACAIFLYIDISLLILGCVSVQVIERHQIKNEVEEMLDTPDLTELERTLSQNNS